jgi:hypothetical protein
LRGVGLISSVRISWRFEVAEKMDTPEVETGQKILKQPLPQVLDDMELHIEKAENAALRAQESAHIAKEIEERLAKAEDRL